MHSTSNPTIRTPMPIHPMKATTATVSPPRRSPNIPIVWRNSSSSGTATMRTRRRTTSTASEELQQLHEKEAMADFRDYAMYTRIVNGIVRTQEKTKDCKLKQENETCLAHVVGARNDCSCCRSPLLNKKEDNEHMVCQIIATRGDSEVLRSSQEMPGTLSGGPGINSDLVLEEDEQTMMFAMDM